MARILLSLFLIAVGCSVNAQSFNRGALVTDFNTGIEVYKTTSTYQGSVRDTIARTIEASSHLTLGMEIGLTKRIGVGLRGKSNVFYQTLNKVTDEKPEISSKDFMLMLNIHPVICKKLDLVLGAEVGLSRLHIDLNNLTESMIEGRGGYYAFYLNPRFYFGRFGVNLKTYLPGISYKKLSSPGTDAGKYILSAWQGSGFGVSAGLQLRLF